MAVSAHVAMTHHIVLTEFLQSLYGDRTNVAILPVRDSSFGPVVAPNSQVGYWDQVSDGSAACHRGWPYTLLQPVQMPGLANAVYGTMYYAEPLSFDKNRTKLRFCTSFCRDIAMIVQKATLTL